MSKRKSPNQNPDVEALSKEWGLDLDPELLVLALTHRSFANEMGGLANNERLEFLGDSVLSIIVTEYLYAAMPDAPERTLADRRASIVSQAPLAKVARSIGLGSYLLLGVGENKTGGRNKDSLLSDALEALIGATYLQYGLEPTREVLLRHLEPVIEAADEPEAILDWKRLLRQFARDHDLGELTFEVTGVGPDHQRVFTSIAHLGDIPFESGQGPSRKKAENDSARQTLQVLEAKQED